MSYWSTGRATAWMAGTIRVACEMGENEKCRFLEKNKHNWAGPLSRAFHYSMVQELETQAKNGGLGSSLVGFDRAFRQLANLDQVRTRKRIKVGDVAVMKRAFSASEVAEFARLSGDENPIHVDGAYAKRSRFGKCIVHGLLTSSLISAVLGARLPGPGTIYLKQTLEFTAPVFIGEEVTCNVRVKQIRGHLIELETQCSKPDGTAAVKGSALVLCEE